MVASVLRLRPLGARDQDAALRAHAELAAEGFPFLLELPESDEPWTDYLLRLVALSRGIDVPAGRVPATFLVADVGGEIVGRASLRHELTEYLATWGGHIGYAVRPAYRRRGYARDILRATLRIAAERGFHRALVTCDDDNLGSIRVIESCGGVLENEVAAPEGDGFKRRYWIATGE